MSSAFDIKYSAQSLFGLSYDYSLVICRETEKRNTLVQHRALNPTTGLYEEMVLEPPAFDDNGDPKSCPCGVST